MEFDTGENVSLLFEKWCHKNSNIFNANKQFVSFQKDVMARCT